MLVGASGFSDAPKMPDFDYVLEEFSSDKDVLATKMGEVQDLESGTDIFEENGMQVFGNWLVLDPGDTRVVEVQYMLPFTLEYVQSYSLAVFSQPGISASHSVSIDPGKSFIIRWCEDGDYTERNFIWERTLDSNLDIVCTLKKT